MGETVFSHFQTLSAISPVYRHLFSYQPSNLPTLFLFFKTQKCLEMGENVFSRFQTLVTVSPVSKHSRTNSVQKREKTVSPISRHFLSFLLFLDTFSLILDTKVSRNGRKWIFIFSHFQTLFVVSPVSRHLFSYFRPKSVQKWELPKNVSDAGPVLVRFPTSLAFGSELGVHYPYRRGIFLFTLPALTIEPEHSWQGAYWIPTCLSWPHDQSQLDFTHWSRRQHSISILHQFATSVLHQSATFAVSRFDCISQFVISDFFSAILICTPALAFHVIKAFHVIRKSAIRIGVLPVGSLPTVPPPFWQNALLHF